MTKLEYGKSEKLMEEVIREAERSIDYCYIGYICEILDNSRVNYHHCRTWFRLFLNDAIYSITATKHNDVNEVVVYKGKHIDWCMNTKALIVFQGTLQDFENWLRSNQ